MSIQDAISVVSANGMALQHMSAELRDNREVAATAVRNRAGAMRFASAKLRLGLLAAVEVVVANK